MKDSGLEIRFTKPFYLDSNFIFMIEVRQHKFVMPWASLPKTLKWLPKEDISCWENESALLKYLFRIPYYLLVGMSTEIQVAIETILPDQSKFIANQISCFDCFDKLKSSTLAKRVLEKLDS